MHIRMCLLETGAVDSKIGVLGPGPATHTNEAGATTRCHPLRWTKSVVANSVLSELRTFRRFDFFVITRRREAE